MAGPARGPPPVLVSPCSQTQERKITLSIDNHGGYLLPDEDREEINYADTLARADWLLVQSDWDGGNNRLHAGISPDADPIADLLRDRVGVWHSGCSEYFHFLEGVGPWAVTAAKVVEWGTRYPHLAEDWPTTPEEADLRLRRVIPNLQADPPSSFWDPSYTEWYMGMWGVSPSSERYKDAYLHAELWRNGDTLEEIYAFVAVKPWDRCPPRRALDREVYWRACSLNKGLESVVDDADDDDFSF